jgi:hypothetical protein
MAATIPPHSPSGLIHSDISSAPLPLDVVAHMTFHTKSSNSKGKKAKTTKDVRVKEFKFTFSPSKTNYFEFLQAILEKHHLSKYKVSDQAVFPCKVQVPPAMYVVPHSRLATADIC